MREAIVSRISTATLIRVGSSLVLALLLWGWVTTSEDPERSRVFPNVEVGIGELPGSLVVVGAIPAIDVRLTGPRSVIDEIDQDEIRASLDLEGIDQIGNYNVRVIVTTPGGVWERQATPPRVPIIVDESTSKVFPVEPIEVGQVDTLRRRITITPSVSEVTVSGPAATVARVEGVILPVDVGARLQDFQGAFEPRAITADGQPVTEVMIAPETIAADVTIASRGKSVAVIAQLIGSPELGFEVLDRAANPATVLVDGPQELLDSLVAVETEPIDLTGAQASISRRVALRDLPDGVRVIDPPSGLVEVFIQIGRRGVRQPLPGLVVEVVNARTGMVVEVQPHDVTVVIVASADLLQELTADDIMVQVDVEGRGPGTYEIRPTVSVPPNVQWVSTEPETVSVVISVAEVRESTPVSSPAPETPVATPN